MGSLLPPCWVSLASPPLLSSALSPRTSPAHSFTTQIDGPPHPPTFALNVDTNFSETHPSTVSLYRRILSIPSSDHLLHLVTSVLQSNFSAPLQSSWHPVLLLLVDMPSTHQAVSPLGAGTRSYPSLCLLTAGGCLALSRYLVTAVQINPFRSTEAAGAKANRHHSQKLNSTSSRCQGTCLYSSRATVHIIFCGLWSGGSLT